MADRLDRAFARLDDEATSVPPGGLVATARAQAARLRGARRARLQRTFGVAAVALAVAVGFSFTSPGRAATGWIADLAGFGEEPTLPQAGAVEGSAVVLASGTLDDGTHYEVVAKRPDVRDSPSIPASVPDDVRDELERDRASFEQAVCIQLDWPDVTARGMGGHCARGPGPENGIGSASAGLFQPPDGPDSQSVDHNAPGIFLARLNPAVAAHARVLELHPDGTSVEIPSEVVVLEGPPLARLAVSEPRGALIAALDQKTVMAGRAGEIEVRAVAYDEGGNELGNDEADFRPASCPEDPAKPSPPPPAGERWDGQSPTVASVHEMEWYYEPFTDRCPPMLMTLGPPRFTSHELTDGSVPAILRAAAKGAGFPLEPPRRADVTAVHTPGADLVSVDNAADRTADGVRNVFNTGWIGGPGGIYLARLIDEDRLVYVVRHPVRGLGDGRDPQLLPEERRFLGIVDAKTGERIYFGEY